MNIRRMLGVVLGFVAGVSAGTWTHRALQSAVTHVQPMTGIGLWADGGTDPAVNSIQLEFRYLRYADVVKQKGVWNWDTVESTLSEVAARGHQAILRFYDVYPNEPSGVPDYILALPDFRDTTALSEGNPTVFPDWGNTELQSFALDFYSKLATRYDSDPRLAFLEVGFGLWAEYHIYDGPMILGRTFPDIAYQQKFLQHLDSVFVYLPWGISIDAASEWAPFQTVPKLMQLGIGHFDDSFLNVDQNGYNLESWNFFGTDRWKSVFAGGEFSYYTTNDQKLALSTTGPHGLSFDSAAGIYHITFMIGADQPSYQTWTRIAQASMKTGYHFQVTDFIASADSAVIRITNKGVAPLYRDAWPALDGIRTTQSLRGLLPGDTTAFVIARGGANPVLSIACDHLVTGQKIEFDANLSDTSPSSVLRRNAVIRKERDTRYYRINGQRLDSPLQGNGK